MDGDQDTWCGRHIESAFTPVGITDAAKGESGVAGLEVVVGNTHVVGSGFDVRESDGMASGSLQVIFNFNVKGEGRFATQTDGNMVFGTTAHIALAETVCFAWFGEGGRRSWIYNLSYDKSIVFLRIVVIIVVS